MYKHFNRFNKKVVDVQESTAGKIKLSCASDTLILPIEFTKKEDYEKEFAPKRKERLLA